MTGSLQKAPTPKSRRAPVVPGAQRRPRSRNPFAAHGSESRRDWQGIAALLSCKVLARCGAFAYNPAQQHPPRLSTMRTMGGYFFVGAEK